MPTPMKIKAAVFRGVGVPLSIESVEVADPGPEEVLVRTAACGVCHSDLHFVQGSIRGRAPASLATSPLA